MAGWGVFFYYPYVWGEDKIESTNPYLKQSFDPTKYSNDQRKQIDSGEIPLPGRENKFKPQLFNKLKIVINSFSFR